MSLGIYSVNYMRDTDDSHWVSGVSGNIMMHDEKQNVGKIGSHVNVAALHYNVHCRITE